MSGCGASCKVRDKAPRLQVGGYIVVGYTCKSVRGGGELIGRYPRTQDYSKSISSENQTKAVSETNVHCCMQNSSRQLPSISVDKKGKQKLRVSLTNAKETSLPSATNSKTCANHNKAANTSKPSHHLQSPVKEVLRPSPSPVISAASQAPPRYPSSLHPSFPAPQHRTYSY